MAAQFVDSAHWRAHARRHPLRYRLAIVAPNAVEVVRYAGGWLFDRTTAGWEVTVLVDDHSDDRPLQILGATVLDIEQSLAAPKHETWPHAVAVPTQMFADCRVRDGILDCLDTRSAELSLWGDAIPAELADRVKITHHRVSRAARAFKACALATAGFPAEEVGPTEVFRVSASRSTAGLVSAS
ncbi:hypothetical protein ACFV24_29190 [Nocardia fluminea]|uniref:hypothetical protein n=1 Tax=Nocardia fluminea TaxID=134984 RepID=UPI003404590D